MSMPELSRAPLSGDAPYFAVELEPVDGALWLLEQRELPERERYLRLTTADEAARAIKDMTVRGAPAIGITAAYAMAMVARKERGDAAVFLMALGVAGRFLDATRPTAVNLAWAIARMARKGADVAKLEPDARSAAMQAEAEAIHREDVAACKRMGELGAAWVPYCIHMLDHAGISITERYIQAFGETVTERPSDVFRRHVWVSPFPEEDIGALAGQIGADRVLFGSDWPHAEGTEEPADYVEYLSGFSPDDTRKILRDNALAVLGS